MLTKVSAPLLLLILFTGCGVFSDKELDKPAFIGEWKSSDSIVFTVEDSLHRDSLRNYLFDRGINIDMYFSDAQYRQGNEAVFNKLVKDFTFSCNPQNRCSDTLWVKTSKTTFTVDSFFIHILKNNIVQQVSQRKYYYDLDSIYFYHPYRGVSFHYYFTADDTLILNQSELIDTLIRL